jgi:hypothetical protein
MSNPFITAEDASRKGFDFSPWGGIEGFLKIAKTGGFGGGAQIKRMLPDLAHAVDMTATAISSLPFEIVPYEDKPKAAPDTGKPTEGAKPEQQETEVFDSSDDWKNKLGGMPNPQRLIYLIASSLCGGKAYVIPTRTPKMIFDLQYCAPHTVTPQILRDGLQYFDRATDQGKTERYNPDKIMYFWLPDSDVEIGPAENHPLGNAMLDAQMILAMKTTLRQYGERGFVPITLLGAKGMPSGAEREKAEGFFDRLLRGGFDVLAKIVNADALELIPVGAGMEQLKQSYLEIRRDAKEGIGDAFGIPASMFLSDKAFASEMDILMRQWYSDSRFVSIYQTIEEVFTEQLFKKFNYKMRFKLDSLDIFQEDENQKAASLGTIVSAISTDPAIAKFSMSILGYELDKEQESELDKLITEKAAEKEQEKEMQAQQMQQDADLQREAIAAKPAAPAKSLSADELKDLALWYEKSRTWYAKGKGVAIDWENKHLREDIAAPIRLKLASAKSESDIMQAFALGETTTPAPVYYTETVPLDPNIKALVETIERAIAATKAE